MCIYEYVYDVHIIYNIKHTHILNCSAGSRRVSTLVT